MKASAYPISTTNHFEQAGTILPTLTGVNNLTELVKGATGKQR